MRQANLTGEALHHLFISKTKQVERQEQDMWCEVADDSVVVINSEPMKGGNMLEEKTQKILCIKLQQADSNQKLLSIAKG